MADENNPTKTPAKPQASPPQTPKYSFRDILEDAEKLSAIQEQAAAVLSANTAKLSSATGLLATQSNQALERMQQAYANIKRNNGNPKFYNGLMVLFGDSTYNNRHEATVLQENQMQVEMANSRLSMLRNLNEAQKNVAMAAITQAEKRLKLKLDLRSEARAMSAEQRAQAGEQRAIAAEGRAVAQEARTQALFPFQMRTAAAGADKAEHDLLISQSNVLKDRLQSASEDALIAMAQDPENETVKGFIDEEIQRRRNRDVATQKAVLGLQLDELNIDSKNIDLANSKKQYKLDVAEDYVKSLTNSEIDTLTRAAENGMTSVTIPTSSGEMNVTVTRQQLDQWAAEVTTAQRARVGEALDANMAASNATVALSGATHTLTASRLFNIDIGENSPEASLFQAGNVAYISANNTQDKISRAALFNQSATIFNELDRRLSERLSQVDKDLQPHVNYVLDNGTVTQDGASEFLLRAMPSPQGTVSPQFQDTFKLLRQDIARRINPTILQNNPSTGQQTVDLNAMVAATTGGEKTRFRSYLTAALDNPEVRTQLQTDIQADYMLFTLGQMQKSGIDVKELITVTNGTPQWRNNVFTDGAFDQAKVLRILAAKGIDSIDTGGTVEDLFYNHFVTLYRSPENTGKYEGLVSDTMDIEALSLLKMITGKDSVLNLTQAIMLEDAKPNIFNPLIQEKQRLQGQANELAAQMGKQPSAITAMDMAISGTSTGKLTDDIRDYNALLQTTQPQAGPNSMGGISMPN